MHRNVWVNLLYGALQAAASSLQQGAFFPLYITQGLRLSDADVGYLFSTSGLVMVVLALPLGLLTDLMSRQRILVAGTIAGLLTSALQAAALQLQSVPLLYVAAALGGATTAITGPSLAAVYADSIPTGSRTALYTLQYSATLAFGTLGPCSAVLFFYLFGDQWSLQALTIVMQSGNVLAFCSFLLLLLIRDDKTLGAESEGVLGKQEEEKQQQQQQQQQGSAEPAINSAAAPLLGEKEEEGAEEEESASATLGLGHQTCRLCCCTLRVSHIPLLLFLSDAAIALGAGATVAFFPLFFTGVFHTSPMALSAIFAAVPLLVAGAGLALVPLSKAVGRAWAATLADAAGTAALFALCLVHSKALAIATYLVRSALMNASYSVQRGILMDVVKKDRRGFWSSLENLTAATWAGSSLVGGLLVQRYSFQTVFFATACLYSLGTALLAPIIVLTAGERVDGRQGRHK